MTTIRNELLLVMIGSIVFSAGAFTFVDAEMPGEVQEELINKLPTQAIQNAKIFQQTFYSHEGLEATFQPILTSYWSPNNDRTFDETQAKLQVFRTDENGVVGCSGTLIDRTHVLSAGHCFADANGVLVQDPLNSSIAYFYDLNQNQFEYVITEIVLHPQYDGKGEKGFDLSILTLESEVDPSIPTIALDRNPVDDVNNNITIESFGVGGYGQTGFDSTLFPFGIERRASTQIDALGDTMYQGLGMTPGIDYEPGFVLQTDFDNGGTNTDAFGFFFGIYQPGTGNDSDGSTCFGDSGGAIFNQSGEATGVNSYVTSLSIFGQTTDVTPDNLDCSFGEFTGHIRVSQHVAWIDSVISTPVPDPDPVPDPEPSVTCGTGTILDTVNNQCIVDYDAIDVSAFCGTGTVYDASSNMCVVDPSTIITCGQGTILDTVTNQCISEPKGKKSNR